MKSEDINDNTQDTENIKDENINSDDSAQNNQRNEENTNTNSSFYWCGDVPFGFQDINPQVFNVIGEILGDVMSNRLPFNIQNVLGNWIQLVGQVIETYSSQQNYFQSGPGRYYNLRYKNVTNPFCDIDNTATESSNNSDNNGEEDDNTKQEIEDMKDMLNNLQSSIKTIEEKINKLENKNS